MFTIEDHNSTISWWQAWPRYWIARLRGRVRVAYIPEDRTSIVYSLDRHDNVTVHRITTS